MQMKIKEILNTAVIVAALGYFVDVYDLVLFLIIGKKSLLDIGVSPKDVIDTFQHLLSIQMVGMLCGGLFFGILGDKKGRLSVLFGSILIYSLANLVNGFVHDIETYKILRFIAGFGLAGELGVGITLVSEVMNKENRGYGTMVVASIGVFGAVAAGLISQIGWQTSYFIGGGLGILLLLMRVSVFESGMYTKTKTMDINKGDFIMLLQSKNIFKYLYCILIGLPVWFIIGILVSLAPQFAKELGVVGIVDDAQSIMLCYSGLVFGDLASGILSNFLRSRKKVFLIFYFFSLSVIVVYLNLYGVSGFIFNTTIFFLGFSVGFWAIFVTVASEQFGTNLRATVTTTVPNFVRGSLVSIVIIFKYFTVTLGLGLILGTGLVTILVFSIAFLALIGLKETFGKDLDYTEIP
jgi:MFS transporter, putative metabolite:H+ symporter